jgi:hypothetical protein
VCILLDPDVAEKEPAGHGEQADDANKDEKNPGLHGVHALETPEPRVEKLPGEHEPEPLTTARIKQKNPGGQGKQTEEPKKSTNDPAEHAVHEALIPLPAVE